MGMIDSEEMGKFKVDMVFTEFAAISDRKWVATTIDGEKVMHCIKGVSYDKVVNEAKNSFYSIFLLSDVVFISDLKS